MNVILLEKIYKLGNIGDEVKVKSGYARNFLIPSGKALYSTPENKEFFKEKSDSIKAENEKTKKDALKIFELLSDKEVILIRAASESGQLFGSVSTKDIIKYLNDEGFNLSKNQVDLNKCTDYILTKHSKNNILVDYFHEENFHNKNFVNDSDGKILYRKLLN